MKRRLLSLLLAFVMVLGMLPVSAFAATAFTAPEVSVSAVTENSITAKTSFNVMELTSAGTSTMAVEISKTEDFAEVLDTKETTVRDSLISSYEFTGLDAGTDYFIRAQIVSANDSYEDSAYSAVVKATTTAASCEHAETTTNYVQEEGTETHTVTVTCDSCSEQISQTTEDCVDEGKDGTCDVCGGTVAVPCEHTETTTTYKQAEDSETHTVTVTCANEDCGEQISQTTEDCVDEGKDGTCDICGGTVAVAEEGVYEDYTFKTSLSAASSYVSNITSVTLTADVRKAEVSSDGKTWDVILAGCNEELPISLTLENSRYLSYAYIKFNDEYTSASSGSWSTTLTPGFAGNNGTVSYSFVSNYNKKTTSTRNATYTLNLTLLADDYENQAPEITGNTDTAPSIRTDEVYSLDLSTIFTDVDDNNSSLTYKVSVDGAEAVATEAAYTYTPAGVETKILAFTAIDPWGAESKTFTVELTVKDNTAPELTGEAAESATGMHGIAWTIDLSKLFTDSDGDTLTYTVAIDGAEAVTASSSYSYAPTSAGTHTLVFQAADVKSAVSPVYTVTLTAAENNAPTLTGDASASDSVDQYNTWTLDLSTIFADADEGDSLTYTVSIDGADAVSANSSYSYSASADGTYTFVFQATDQAGNTAPEYTVTLTVNFVPKTTITTECVKKAGNYDGWLSSITVTGPLITGYEWLGGGSGHDETSDTDHTLNIQLDTSVADDATIALAYAMGGGGTRYAKYASTPPASVTLVDGQATVTVTTTSNTIASWVTTRNYTINFTNKINNVPEATMEAISADVEAGKTYELNLNDYYTDADGDTLTYKVSINGAEAVAADAAYSYTPTTLGTHTLTFTANDVWSDSTKNLTVTLNVANSETTYDVSVTAPEGYALTFQAVSAVEDGTPVLAGELTYADGVVKVPENISVITWACDGYVSGTAQVSSGAAVEIKALTLSAKTAAGDVDTDAVIQVTDSNGAVVTVGTNGIAHLAAGSGYTYTATPSTSTWNAATLSEQTVSEDASVVLDFTLKSAKSVTVPAEAEVLLYYVTKNFGGNRVNPVYTTNNEDGTVTYYYSCTGSQGYNAGYVYRATNSGKITKAGYMKTVDDVILTWSDDDKTPSYRGAIDIPNYSDTSGNQQWRAGDNVLMNLNGRGAISLSGTQDVGAFRNWNIIDSDTTNVGIEPDFNFKIVAGDNVVSFTDLSSTYGNNWQRLTKTGEGTAFVEVSFDAIHIVNGWPEGGAGGAYGQMNDVVYNASNPNTTGFIVVQTDGNAASDVTFNIASDRSQLGREWDAEVDTYYLTEDTGFLTLAPTATSGVKSVAISNDKGATWTTLTAEETGAYTGTVVPGNNIVRVTNGNGQTAYQVVRALKLDITVANVTDSTKGSEFAPGDTVQISISGLISPVMKMGGIYNPQSVAGSFTGSDGNSYSISGQSGGWTGGYAFNGRTYYLNDIVIPEDGKLTLSGNYMTVGGFSINLGLHRGITMDGVGSNTSASTGGANASVLPVIVLGEEETVRPQLKGESEITTSMRRNQWYDIDLADYFVDEDSETLTYYIMENGASEWTQLSGSAYTYYPADDGEQIVCFTALDESMTLEDVTDETPMLVLTANVEAAPSTVEVTFSVTQGVDKFYTSKENKILIPQTITVPYFDLSLYGLTNYYYNPRCYAGYEPGTIGNGTPGTKDTAEGVVTTLHVFIWATEVYQLGYSPAQAGKGTSYSDGSLAKYFAVSGQAGSAFVNLWNGTNMNYYLNMEYPLGCTGTGSTCDQQALYNGDVISVHFIEDTTVMGSSFAAVVQDSNGTYEHATDATSAEVNKGDTITLTAYQSVSDWTTYTTSYAPNADAKVVYIAEEDFVADTSTWKDLGTTGDDGKIEIDTSGLSSGTYYIAVQGTVDYDASKECEVTVFKLTVTGSEEEIAYGDVNGDGDFTYEDVMLAYQAYTEAGTLTADQMKAADMDGDGELTYDDIMAIYNVYAQN